MIKRLETPPTPEEIELSIQRDSCGRNEDIVQFVKLLGSVEGPYCIMLDSPWGDGKTFFVRSVEHVLKHLNQYIINGGTLDEGKLAPVACKLADAGLFLPFYFNAWENDFFEDPLSPLFASMAAEFSRMGITDKDGASFREIAGGVLDIIADVCQTCMIPVPHLSGAINAASGESLIDAFEKKKEIRSRVDQLAEACRHEVADKLVIFIDELDRCRPDFAVRLLEQTKSLFQSDGIILVISTDSEQLANAVGGMYGSGFDSRKFLERFYDRRVTLSPVDSYSFVYGTGGNRDLFSCFKEELLKSETLVIRDCMRLSKLDDAERYCRSTDGKTGSPLFVKCILLPLLVFIEYLDPAMFKRITRERRYEDLYDYGKEFQWFTRTAAEAMASAGNSYTVPEPFVTRDDAIKQYVVDVCRIIFDKDRESTELFDSMGRINDSGPYLIYRRYNRICTLLEFPTDSSDQGRQQTA